MRNMWDEIRANKRYSLLLMIAVSLVLVGLGAAIGLYFGSTRGGIVFGVVLAFFLSLLSFFGSDEVVLSVSEAKPVTHEQMPQLFNVVDEMRIAAGVPMPKVYVIDDTAPNAFATGRDPEHASIAVTRGLLTKLNREELQGVIGHEMSHVRNFDIRFAMLLAVMVGTIALISDFFLRSVFWGGGRRGRSRGRGGGGGAIIIVIVALVFAILAPIAAKLIELAASRRREYMADAGSVELTRNPLGLALALEKISNDPDILEVANRATQHLYIVNPIKPFEERAAQLFSTHPPIYERIKRLREMAHASSRQ